MEWKKKGTCLTSFNANDNSSSFMHDKLLWRSFSKYIFRLYFYSSIHLLIVMQLSRYIPTSTYKMKGCIPEYELPSTSQYYLEYISKKWIAPVLALASFIFNCLRLYTIFLYANGKLLQQTLTFSAICWSNCFYKYRTVWR